MDTYDRMMLLFYKVKLQKKRTKRENNRDFVKNVGEFINKLKHNFT